MRVAAIILVSAAVALAGACGGDDDADPMNATTTWLAIVAAADDPNELEARYEDLQADAASLDGVVLSLSRTACLGLPSDVGAADYVIAVEGEQRSEVEAVASELKAADPTAYEVTITCD